jgi:hypothetical protein
MKAAILEKIQDSLPDRKKMKITDQLAVTQGLYAMG